HGVGKRDRVLAVEARAAEVLLRYGGGVDEVDEVDVGQRVGIDRAADLDGVQPGGDQLGAGGEVDAVQAGPLHRRRGDAYVHLAGAGLTQHPNQRALGVAAHDRVVDDHEALALDDVAQRVELEPDAELTNRLRRLDERTPDVGVLDQPDAVRNAGLLRIPDGGGCPGLRHRDDQVGVGGELTGQPATDLDPDAVHALLVHQGVGACEVDELEEA